MKNDAAANATVLAGPFVSYAREDQPFVRRLHEALDQRQRDTWVDWEGIYPTEEWMARIRSAIDAAQAFVFVISPHSVASPVCSQEIDHAVTQGKRIIPIVAAEVDAASVHPAVAKLNWLAFREADDFNAQVDALVAAMDLDVGWLRDHTRLLVRAEEWQKRDRDASLLLRGNDLKAAEQWLLGADAAKRQAPTPLQTQFVVTSRQADTRRRNLQRTLATVALVVLSALSVYSWIQKTIAERQRNLAISRQLAARAATITDDGSLARLLVSGLATRYSHSPEADASLARALIPTVPLARALWSPSRADSIECLSFHPGGAFLAGSNTHGVTVWRIDTGQVEAFLSADDGVDCVVFGPRDDVVAISDEGRVILWEWREGRTRTLGGELNHETTRSAFSTDGRSVFVASLGQVTRWDIERATPVVVIAQPSGSYRYAFAPDATRMAAADENQRITIWNLQTGQRLTELQAPQGAGTVIAFAADGRALAAGRDSIMVWDVDDQGARLVNELTGVAVPVALAFSHTGDRLTAVGTDGAILQWDYHRRSQQRPLATVPFTASVAFAPGDATVATGGRFGSIRLWHRASQLEHILQRQVGAEVMSEESAESGAMIALTRGDGFVFWNPDRTQALVDVADFPEQRRAIQLSARGHTMAVLDNDGRVGLWDTSTGRRMSQIALSGLVERIDVSDKGAFVAGVDSDGGIFVANAGGVQTWSKAADQTGHARSAAFSPDEQRVASGGLEGDIHLWDVRSGEHQFAIQNGSGNVLALAFSPDGRELAANRGSDIVIWNLTTRQPRRTIRGHDSVVLTVAFSPDGALLASGSLDKTARLWNPISGDELFRLDTTPAASVIGVAFTRDGKTLATRNESRRVSLWNVDSDRWTALACDIANRNLSVEEWDRFLPSETYRAACPDLPVPFPSNGALGSRPPAHIP